jgi:hypothetical protein
MRTFETAFDSGHSSRDYLRVLESVHDDFMAGQRPVARPRPVIEKSWRRVQALGVQPDHDTSEPGSAAADPAPAATSPQEAGTDLTALLPLLQYQTDPLLDDDNTLVVLANDSARVIWRGGTRSMRRRADSLGFTPGHDWSEGAVGTNGIGSALATRAPVHVHGPEHFCYDQHPWSCAAAPVVDPRSRSVIGVIDLSFPTDEAYSGAVVLASSLARQAELELREAHHRDLAALASLAAGRAGTAGRWAAVDRWGWVANASGITMPQRLTLPDRMDGPLVVDRIGAVEPVPLGDGWLLVPCGSAPAGPQPIRLRVGAGRCEVLTGGPGNAWSHALTGRRATIVAVLADNPEGLSARELAAQVYGSEASRVAVRSEIHRIRREIGGLIGTHPYRLSENVLVERVPAAQE